MKKYNEMMPHIKSKEYEMNFWNAMRNKPYAGEKLAEGIDTATGAFTLTAAGQEKYLSVVKKEGVFRNIAADINTYDHENRIKTVAEDNIAAWVSEGEAIPISDGSNDFGEVKLLTHRLAVFLKLQEAFVKDHTFLMEDYLVSRLAKNFSRAEDNGFINGTGVDMPTGILTEEGGAEIGVTTTELTYDDVIRLYFSVKPEYRKNAVWLMNDETALALRTMKDLNGNYIWNHANDTILGKKVYISEFMPNAEDSNKPIAFGDFNYYWIVNRHPISIRTLVEQFASIGCIGYLAYEFLDGKLTRSEAIKVMQMTNTTA